MKFILNTSLDPHFCVLFDTQGNLVDSLYWENRKRTGELVWQFFEKNKIFEKEIKFLGGISGPGGFSNLRGASGILNTLSLKHGCQVHQVRADYFLKRILEKNNFLEENYLLNSFSDGVFYQDEDEKLVRLTIDDAVKEFGENKIFVGFLPEEKSNKFSKKIILNLENIEGVLLELLEERTPQSYFIPDYEFPAV